MGQSKLSMQLFLLRDITKLSSVKKDILSNIIEEKFGAKKDQPLIQKLPESERVLYYKWDEKSKEAKIKTSIIEGKGKLIQTMDTMANIEYAKRREKDANNNFLPKSERVGIINARVLFFQYEEKFYVIIFSSNGTTVERVKKLIGQKIVTEVDDNFILSNDLFNWLFYKYSENKGLLEEKLTVTNISGFIGNVIDRDNIFKGTSDQTSDLIITKAFISNGETLKSVTTCIETEEGKIYFSIDERSNATLFLNLSLFFFSDEENRDTLLPIYLYTFLIPILKKIFAKESKEFMTNDKKEFSSKIGLEVIKSIMKYNDITLDEIKSNKLKESVTEGV